MTGLAIYDERLWYLVAEPAITIPDDLPAVVCIAYSEQLRRGREVRRVVAA